MSVDYNLGAKIITVGLVGTGYAAKKRAEAFKNNPDSKLVAVAGNTITKTEDFCQTFNLPPVNSWQELINDRHIDLICICNANSKHGEIVKSALLADKHVIVEYPLSLDPIEAEELIKLARQKQKLLHVEHIEIIGGVHQAIKQNITKIGNPLLARYSTISAKYKQTPHWTYNYDDYGFPLTAALSRINRFVDLFGEVDSVGCYGRYWDAPTDGYFSACYFQAQLKFNNRMLVNITYAKGNKFKISDRTLEIHGDEATLKFIGEKGTIIRGKEITEIEVGSRIGLFARDTQMVLQHLRQNKPLYINDRQSAYSLKVAQAVNRAYQKETIVKMSNE